MKQKDPEKLQQARNLFFNTTLTQAQIAQLIDVSERTISNYVAENNWKLLKKRASQMPGIYLEHMNNELQEMNELIAARPKGKRFPTLREAEIRRKIMYSIATIKDRYSAGTHAAVLTNFMYRIAGQSMADAKIFNRYLDKYILGEMSISGETAVNTYSLPGGKIIRDADNPDAETV